MKINRCGWSELTTYLNVIKLKCMTVKDLINQLKTLPQDKQIILEHTDHTDYTYTTPLTSDSVIEDEWWDESNDDDDKDYDESLQDVVKIICSFW